MDHNELKKTITYKDLKKQVKIFIIALVFVIIVFSCTGLGLFLSSMNSMKEVGLAMLIACFIMLIIFSVPIIILLALAVGDLHDLDNNLDDMYIFEYKFKKPIDKRTYFSKYHVSFEYDNEKYDMFTDWLFDDNNLDDSNVTIGYIKKEEKIIVLFKNEKTD